VIYVLGGQVSQKRSPVSCHTTADFKGKSWHYFSENGLKICRGISFNPDIGGPYEDDRKTLGHKQNGRHGILACYISTMRGASEERRCFIKINNRV
jgi:hypothetical protein